MSGIDVLPTEFDSETDVTVMGCGDAQVMLNRLVHALAIPPAPGCNQVLEEAHERFRAVDVSAVDSLSGFQVLRPDSHVEYLYQSCSRPMPD